MSGPGPDGIIGLGRDLTVYTGGSQQWASLRHIKAESDIRADVAELCDYMIERWTLLKIESQNDRESPIWAKPL